MGSLFERFSRNPTPTTRIGAGFPPFPSTGSFSPPSPPRDEPRRSGESGAMAAPFIYCRSSIEGNTEDALLKAAFDGDLARVKDCGPGRTGERLNVRRVCCSTAGRLHTPWKLQTSTCWCGMFVA
nr:uncharacterized protein LOC117847110 isoform X2 [Setaria viridis]